MKKNYALCLMLPLTLIAFSKIQAEEKEEVGVVSLQQQKQLSYQNRIFTDHDKGIEPHLVMFSFPHLRIAEREDAFKFVVKVSQQDQANYFTSTHIPTEETSLYSSTTLLTDESRVHVFSEVDHAASAIGAFRIAASTCTDKKELIIVEERNILSIQSRDAGQLSLVVKPKLKIETSSKR